MYVQYLPVRVLEKEEQRARQHANIISKRFSSHINLDFGVFHQVFGTFLEKRFGNSVTLLYVGESVKWSQTSKVYFRKNWDSSLICLFSWIFQWDFRYDNSKLHNWRHPTRVDFQSTLLGRNQLFKLSFCASWIKYWDCASKALKRPNLWVVEAAIWKFCKLSSWEEECRYFAINCKIFAQKSKVWERRKYWKFLSYWIEVWTWPFAKVKGARTNSLVNSDNKSFLCSCRCWGLKFRASFFSVFIFLTLPRDGL